MDKHLVDHLHLQSDVASACVPFGVIRLSERSIKIACALESPTPGNERFDQITGHVHAYEFGTKTSGRHCDTAIEKWSNERDTIIKFRTSRQTFCLLPQLMRHP